MEMVFVLDCSGSMNGRPIDQARAAILEALDMLEPQGSFQVDPLFKRRQPIQQGSRSMQRTATSPAPSGTCVASRGIGGTQMIEGIRAALDFPHDPRRLRFVTFLTDGYIGNEVQILAEIHRSIGESRVFSFGVGSSVNRYLMERMASAGRGAEPRAAHPKAFPRKHLRPIPSRVFPRIHFPLAMCRLRSKTPGSRTRFCRPSTSWYIFVGYIHIPYRLGDNGGIRCSSPHESAQSDGSS